jgi:Ni/Co efflux regulator RcnB
VIVPVFSRHIHGHQQNTGCSRNYSRISVGFSLGSGYYGSRYWINDPWRYRLPAAYGSYRWVRYYDDVLLVDLRNGRVVDVIRDFFW